MIVWLWCFRRDVTGTEETRADGPSCFWLHFPVCSSQVSAMYEGFDQPVLQKKHYAKNYKAGPKSGSVCPHDVDVMLLLSCPVAITPFLALNTTPEPSAPRALSWIANEISEHFIVMPHLSK